MLIKPNIRSTLILFLTLGLAGCTESYEWNQKLTVTVDTPTGVKSGYAIIREAVRSGQVPLSQSAVSYQLIGEATVVEVAPGKYLFALLDGAEERPARTFRNGKETPDEVFSNVQSSREVRELRGNKPMFVTFDDLNNPETVKLVDQDHLDASFGEGFALKSITLEITDEKATSGQVQKLLSWLGKYPEPALCQLRNQDIPFCRTVHHGDFIRR